MSYSDYLQYLVSDEEYEVIAQEFYAQLLPVLNDLAEEIQEMYYDPEFERLDVKDFCNYIELNWDIAREIAHRVGWDVGIAPHMKAYLSDFVELAVKTPLGYIDRLKEIAYGLACVPGEVATKFANRGVIVTASDGEYEAIEIEKSYFFGSLQ